MAVSGELAKYIGGELAKNAGKELATKAVTSTLSSIVPKVATKAGTKAANKIGNEFIAGSILNSLAPTTRMLDKAGKPVTFYHSTPNEFDKFDDAMLGSNTGYDNTALGHFVTPDKDFSMRFRDINNTGKPGRTMELQGNIQKPILHPYFAGAKYKDPAVRDKIVENYLLATDNQEGLKMLRDMADEDALEFGGDANLYNEYMALADDPGGGGPFEFAGDERELLKKKGYDAVEIVEGPKSGLVEGAKSDAPVSSYAVFSGENLRPVRHIPVEGSSSLSSIIPVKRKLYRGQQYSNTDFSYNSELMNENPDKWGSKDVGKGYHFTPKKGMAGSWEGSDGGVIEVDYTPDQVLKADDARKMIKEANELLADDKYMAKLWQENEVMAEQIEKIADGNLEALAKREGKPFVQHLKANDDELGTMYYYKDIDPELTDRFVSEFKQKAEKYMPKRASANGDDMVTLFHNTKAENIPSIMEQGLIPGKRPEGYLASPEEAGIWTDDRGLKSGSYGGTTVKIRVPKKEFDATRVNDTQNLLNRAIKPSEIEGVDYMLYDTPLIKNSNLQEYIDKYGEDKVRELIEKKALVSPEVIDKSFSDLKSGRSLTKPNIQQSKVELSPDQKQVSPRVKVAENQLSLFDLLDAPSEVKIRALNYLDKPINWAENNPAFNKLTPAQKQSFADLAVKKLGNNPTTYDVNQLFDPFYKNARKENGMALFNSDENQGFLNKLGIKDYTSMKGTLANEGEHTYTISNTTGLPYNEKITLNASVMENMLKLQSTELHEAAHAAWLRLSPEQKISIGQNLCDKFGVDAKVGKRIANSNDLNELIAYSCEANFTSGNIVGDDGKLLDSVLGNSTAQMHLDNVAKMAGDVSPSFKERVMNVIRAFVDYIKAKVKGIRDIGTFDEFYDGLSSGDFAEDMSTPIEKWSAPTKTASEQAKDELFNKLGALHKAREIPSGAFLSIDNMIRPENSIDDIMNYINQVYPDVAEKLTK